MQWVLCLSGHEQDLEFFVGSFTQWCLTCDTTELEQILTETSLIMASSHKEWNCFRF